MTAPFKDEDIVALYKESATESPSAELDNTILDYAKQQSRRKHQWWPYVGLAATVGFVALLAPWKWADKTLQTPAEIELRSAPSMIQSDAAPKRQVGEMQSFELHAEDSNEIMRFDRVSPEAAKSMAEDKAQPVNNPFADVEALLAKGETAEARALLKQKLDAEPALKAQLPMHLKQLLESKE